MRKIEEDLLSHITALNEAFRGMRAGLTTGCEDIMTQQEFVMENGSFWEPAPLPEGIEKGFMKACFDNSQRLARKQGFRYVEGFALGACCIPVLHAWCVGRDGAVIDATPVWDGVEAAYLGVPFEISDVGEMIDGNQHSISVIDNWEKGFPLLRRSI